MKFQYLFVYGTLKSNPGSLWHDRLIKEHFTYVGQAEINAVLYNLGDFPGITDPGQSLEMVQGELYEFNPELTSLSPIDEYEGCGNDYPEPHLYERKLIAAISKESKSYPAWSYFYLGSVDGLEPMGSSWKEVHCKD